MQKAALIIAILLVVIIILLIVILIRTRSRFPEQQIFVEEEPAIVVVSPPAISRYPLYDIRRQPPGILNIPPPPNHPVYFNHPNGARLGRGPTYYH